MQGLWDLRRNGEIQVSLQNNWFDVKKLGNFPISLEENVEYTVPYTLQQPKEKSTCNWLDLEALGF